MVMKLIDSDKEEAIRELSKKGWKYQSERDAISKTFEFANFIEAFSWMTKVAIWAEKLNHHPEWSNVYKKVEVFLTTHDCGGLSDLDLQMAKKMDLSIK